MTYARCTVLAPNLLFGGRKSPQIMYSCPKEWGVSAYKVDLEVAFAWLPTAPDTSAKGGQSEALWQLGEQVRGKVMRLWRTAERVAR